MKRRRAAVGLVLLAVVGPATTGAQQVDSALARIERLIVAGDRALARGVADSLVAALPAESPRVGEVLFWRAASASNAADAERDYIRIGVEHPFSPRAADALLALGQLELARGDRASARRRFDRALRDYPSGRHVARASLWSGRLAMEERDAAAGCATLAVARPGVPAADVELANQFDYYLAQCARLPAPTDSTPPPTIAEPAAPQFSVQIAAYSSVGEADAMTARLKARGFDVRSIQITGHSVPYRVRIGRYASRREAVAALGRIRGAGLRGIVVEAEPR